MNCSCRIPQTASWVESAVTPLTRLSTLWLQRRSTRLCRIANGDEFNDDDSDDNQIILEQESDENVQHGPARKTGVSSQAAELRGLFCTEASKHDSVLTVTENICCFIFVDYVNDIRIISTLIFL